MRNDNLQIPEALLRFLDERTAVDRKPSSETYDLAATDDEVKARADIARRILQKLGILEEMEELWKLDAARRLRLTKDEE